MRSIESLISIVISCLFSFLLCSCSYHSASYGSDYASNNPASLPADYASRLPQHIATNEKTVVVDPQVHVWGAYGSDGELVKAGIASAGSNWCRDLGRPCRTSSGHFRVFSLGDASCKSHIFPKPRGGAPMPYCMYFNHGQALHGVPPNEVGEGNYSHGCVRMQVSDAEWLRYNFVNVGTKVVVKSY